MLRITATRWLRNRSSLRFSRVLSSRRHLSFSKPVRASGPTASITYRSIATQTEPIQEDSNMCTSTDSTTQQPSVTTESVKAAFEHLLGVVPKTSDTSNKNDDDLKNTFYQRELPSTLVRFASPEGKKLFREAMDEGHAEGFFPLTGNFTTQSEPAYCGPSSLAMVLNALEVDPKRRWKGNWRWFSDEFLQCCSSKEEMKQKGITFDNFACLAKCHADVQVKRAFEFTFEEFKKDVEMVTSTSDKFMVLSFSRKTLQQTGDGHFSPIGAYNAEAEKVLVLDTARYKYPSYWCSIETLFESMKPVDAETGRPRGYFILSYDSEHPPVSLCSVSKNEPQQEQQQSSQSDKQGIAVQKGTPTSTDTSAEKNNNPKLNWSTIAKSFCKLIPENMWLEKPRTLQHVVQLVLRNIPKEYATILANKSLASFNASTTSKPMKAEEYIAQLLSDTTKSPLYPIVMDALYPDRENQTYTRIDSDAAFATLFVLGSPRMLYTSLPKELQDRLDTYRRDDSLTAIMKQEIKRISQEVVDLTTTFCTCGPGWSSSELNNTRNFCKSSS
ncbi:Phytochelatin synthase-domain-containing protein [Mycotypha africana]|uniref:Phytochelatin synthase-domain-containing protein n=1 Tax=Mycotypha africana TaxID=64632 RepID=UPI002301A007|nr:Phytochelatin synthase-domain-containing protein [Mycotypha africana]KAI8991776.1 Phytochelatin synthase-domain-containing protein [Mycotypha africana]